MDGLVYLTRTGKSFLRFSRFGRIKLELCTKILPELNGIPYKLFQWYLKVVEVILSYIQNVMYTKYAHFEINLNINHSIQKA